MRILRHLRSGVAYDLEACALRRQVPVPTMPPTCSQHMVRQRQKNWNRTPIQKEEDWEEHSRHWFIAILKSSRACVSSSLTPRIENVP